VVSVTENSEFKLNDRIIKINGTDINTLNDYYATVDELKKGDTVRVTIVRRNIEVVLNITLQ
jgi:S1-C subfamily serine protease